MMARGRKRKTGARKASGDIRPVRGESREERAAQMPHRKVIAFHAKAEIRAKAHDQKAESALGRLNLLGVITENEYQAGRRFAHAVARMRTMMGAPRDSSPSIAGFAEPSSATSQIPDDLAVKWTKEYDAAFASVKDRKAMLAIKRVAIFGDECRDLQQAEALICGLSALRGHYGLTDDRKSENRGK